MDATPVPADYAEVEAAYRVAHAKFTAIRDAYRARKIGDAEFIAGAREFDAARDAWDRFDIAWWACHAR